MSFSSPAHLCSYCGSWSGNHDVLTGIFVWLDREVFLLLAVEARSTLITRLMSA